MRGSSYVVSKLKQKNWGEARGQILKEQPELLPCELKNKLDLYEVSGKLKEKCRPYVSMPFHFKILFSLLSQHFCHQLPVAGEHNKSHSAYGLSAVEGVYPG